MADSPSEALIEEVCEKYGIFDTDVFLVRALLGRKPSQWPGCCGSGCSPCMDDVTAAAAELLRRSDETSGQNENESPT